MCGFWVWKKNENVTNQVKATEQRFTDSAFYYVE